VEVKLEPVNVVLNGLRKMSKAQQGSSSFLYNLTSAFIVACL